MVERLYRFPCMLILIESTLQGTEVKKINKTRSKAKTNKINKSIRIFFGARDGMIQQIQTHNPSLTLNLSGGL